MKTKLTAMLSGLFLYFFLVCPVFAVDDSKAAATTKTIAGTVTVLAVDVPSRVITVKDDSTGEMQTVELPPTVKNLSQLKVGDRITIRYKIGVAAQIKKPDNMEKITETQESAASTPQGSKPGGVAQRTIKTFITVKAVDTENNTLTFEGPKQRTRIIAVKDPKMQNLLKQLKPGDQVEVAYTEALAIDVQAAK